MANTTFDYDILTIDIDNPHIFEVTESNNPKRRIPKLNGNIRYFKDGTGEQKPFLKWAKFKNSRRIKHISIPKNYKYSTVVEF